jgi:hypothetical protein
MKGQKPYTLPDGSVIAVDAGIPEAALDRLNALPRMACESTCAGGHTQRVIDGGEKMTVAEMYRRRDQRRRYRTAFDVAALGRTACIGLRITEPGSFTFPRSDHYRVFTFDEPQKKTLVFIFAPARMTDPAPVSWWDEVCRMLERVCGLPDARRYKRIGRRATQDLNTLKADAQ